MHGLPPSPHPQPHSQELCDHIPYPEKHSSLERGQQFHLRCHVWMWVKYLSTLRLTELLFPCSFGNWSVCVSTLTPTTGLTSDMCTKWLGRCMSGHPVPECSMPQSQTPLVLLEFSPQGHVEAPTAKTRGLSRLPKAAASTTELEAAGLWSNSKVLSLNCCRQSELGEGVWQSLKPLYQLKCEPLPGSFIPVQAHTVRRLAGNRVTGVGEPLQMVNTSWFSS